MDREPPEPLRRRLREIAARRTDARDRVLAAGEMVDSGALLACATPIGAPLGWLVLRRERGELSVVPVDDRSLVLPGDVRVADGAGFRAARSLARASIPAGAVQPDDRVDILGADEIARVRSAIDAGVAIDPAALDDEELDWAARLVRSAEAMGAVARGEAVVIRLDELVDPARVFRSDRDGVVFRATERALAAASSSVEAAFELLARGDCLVMEELDVGVPGRVVLVASERGVGILWEPDRVGVEPPSVGLGERGASGTLLWDRAPDGRAHRVWVDVDGRRQSPVLWLGTSTPLWIEVREGGAFAL